MNNIKTFEDACAALGVSTEIPNFSNTPEKHQKAVIAHYKLVIINQVLNDGWEPDWGNRNEYKYYAWFDFEECSDKSSGFGFSYDGWTRSDTNSSVGSRLCYKTAEIAEYAGEHFLELYKEYFVIA